MHVLAAAPLRVRACMNGSGKLQSILHCSQCSRVLGKRDLFFSVSCTIYWGMWVRRGTRDGVAGRIKSMRLWSFSHCDGEQSGNYGTVMKSLIFYVATV